MSENLQPFLYPFLMTLFAGLSTGIGSALAFFAKGSKSRLLPLSLGLSAGVMIYISFMEIIPQSNSVLCSIQGQRIGSVTTIVSFFAGIMLIAVIDFLVPAVDNPHEIRNISDMDDAQSRKNLKPDLMKLGIVSALAIGIHNFPEGIATFVVASNSIHLGLPMAVAVAIHNIPEGIAVAIPIYYATGNRKKAFYYSFLTGLFEPLGAVIGYTVLTPYMNDFIFSIVLGGVAGIMVFISLDELLPAAEKYGEHHLTTYGLIGGMAIMAISLIMLS
jgi:zinc transporter, ZIP family